jgi:hypothetical protein
MDKKDYDSQFFKKIIPYSILCPEMESKFLKLPFEAFKEDGTPNESFSDVNERTLKSRQYSVFFSVPEDKAYFEMALKKKVLNAVGKSNPNME